MNGRDTREFVIAIVGGLFLLSLTDFHAIISALLLGLTTFVHFAYTVPGSGWAVPFLWIGGLLVCVAWPITGSLWLIDWIRDPRPRSRLYRDKEYEAALARFLTTVNSLEGKKRIPREARRELVQVLRLFEAGVADIVGSRRRDAFRMVWLVRDSKAPEGLVMWAHSKDQLGPHERDIIMNALRLPQWIVTGPHVRAAYPDHLPERMRSFLSIRNLNRWQVGFIIAFDRRLYLSRATMERLTSHLMMFMPLWEISILQRLVIKLEKSDFSGGGTHDVSLDQSSVPASER